MRDQYFPALTGLRAFAALMVFYHHFPVPGLTIAGLDPFSALHTGVPIFFVLSGFLITIRYENSSRLDAPWLKTYFLNRFARIYPLYAILVVLTMLVQGTTTPKHWILNLTLFKGFFEDTKFLGIGQSWSLTVEECFYALAPIFFLFARRKPVRLTAAMMVILAVLLATAHYSSSFQSAIGSIQFIVIYTFMGRFLEFFAGMFLALWVKRHPVSPETKRPACTWLGTLGIGLVVVLLAALKKTDWIMVSVSVGIFLNHLFLPLSTVVLIRGLIQENSLLNRLLSTRFLQLLGRASYAFYLIHIGPLPRALFEGLPIVMGSLFGTTVAHWTELWLASGFGNLVTATLFAIALYLGVEEPIRRRLRRPVATPGGVAAPA